jgi:predicted ATPase
MEEALARHDAILRDVVAAHDGHIVKATGDGVHAVFGRATDAVGAAASSQRALAAEGSAVPGGLRVRVGVHTTEAVARDGDYFGSGVNRAARLMAVAHGGQVVCSQATAELTRDGLGDGLGFVDLGEHRLRDLSRAEHVFQLTGGGLPGDFPPLRSLDAYPSNLPAQLSPFIGRAGEVVSVSKAVRESRLVTLTGVGGVGKTRLALEVAGEVLPDCAGGAWFVDLGGVVDAGALADTVAFTVRVGPQPGVSITEALTAALRDRATLLVLDNCEHLLDGVAGFVDELTRAVPELRVLTTSREALGLSGERVVAVRPLAVPPEDGTDASATDAVRLFVERAAAVRSSFVLGDDNMAAVVRICRRVDGIPLAIELAAARVRSMAPAEIASRLDQRFQLLSSGARGAVSRHQTLRRAVDWSYDLLSEDEAELLQHLSVCVGGFDLAAAESIGASESIEAMLIVDLLDRLVDKSLVVVDDVGSATRYRLLDTIRDYAFERLEAAGRSEDVRAAHAAHFTDLAEELGAGLRSARERDALEQTEWELDNMRAAVVWSTEREDGAMALRILAALSLHGIRIEATVSSWAAGVAEGASKNDERYPVALATAAWRLLRAGDVAGAEQLGLAALTMSTTDTPLSIASRCNVYTTTTAVAIYLGRHAVEQPEDWVACAQQIDDRYQEALAHAMLGVHRSFGGMDGAVDAGEAGVRAARACGSPSALAYALVSLAGTLAQTELTRAVRCLEEAIACAESATNEWAVATATGLLGNVVSRWGDSAQACHAFLEAATRAASSGNRTTMAQALWAIAAHLALAERPEPAAVLDGAAAAILGQDSRAAAGAHRWSDELLAALVALPARVGDAHYAALVARGTAMTDDELLAYARVAVEPLLAEPTPS